MLWGLGRIVFGQLKAIRTELKKWEEGADEETQEEGEPNNGNKMTKRDWGEPTEEGEAEGESGSFDLGKG
jgi:hypothetical protein